MSEKTDLSKIFGEIRELVDPAIYSLLMDGSDKRNEELIKHQMIGGGKRIRPALAIISSRMLGGNDKDVLYPAASLEILHNYTLILDDIIDHSEIRRNISTVWKKYGRSMAECASVDYVSSIFQGTASSNKVAEITDLFARTLKVVFDGEVLDILFERGGREEEPYIIQNRYSQVTLKDYFEMIEKKTAVLLQASCQTGGICAEASGEQINSLKLYGYNLGMAFQIQDDILDIFGDEKSFGKEIGKDIKERKVSNIVILLSLEELSGQDKKEISEIFDKKVVEEPDVKATLKLINKTSSREKAGKIAVEYIDKAKESLKSLPQNEWNTVLSELADYITAREQ